MKKKITLFSIAACVLIAFFFINKDVQNDNSQLFEYKTITVIESIVPSGIGRSRMLSYEEPKNYKEYTSTRSEENNNRNKSERGKIRVKNFEETKLLNFFNIAGIRFQNIVANDALVDSKINEMTTQGWVLSFVNSGVESYAGKDDQNGIYITRYIFKRAIQ